MNFLLSISEPNISLSTHTLYLTELSSRVVGWLRFGRFCLKVGKRVMRGYIRSPKKLSITGQSRVIPTLGEDYTSGNIVKKAHEKLLVPKHLKNSKNFTNPSVT